MKVIASKIWNEFNHTKIAIWVWTVWLNVFVLKTKDFSHGECLTLSWNYWQKEEKIISRKMNKQMILQFFDWSGTTEPKALSYLVLLDIYWTHKWYIYVLPKIDQITFSAAPPFCPVQCNHPLTGFKPSRTNATRLWVGFLNNYVNTSIVCQPILWDIN